MKLQQNERHYKFCTMNETCFLSSFHPRENFVKPISGVSPMAVIHLLLWFHLACGVAKDRGQKELHSVPLLLLKAGTLTESNLVFIPSFFFNEVLTCDFQ